MTEKSTSLSSSDLRPVRRLLATNVCILGCLAGAVFAGAEGSPLGLISVPMAVCGLLLIDHRNAHGLPTWLANMLGFAAFVAATAEFFGESIEGRLLGFGHLLLYLAWILMLQPKGKPQVWWLCALCTLQVATGAVLTNEFWFAAAAVIYMLLALWTLSIFSLSRAIAASAGVEQSARHAGESNHDRKPPANVTEHPASRSRSNVLLESTSRWVTPRFVLGVAINGVLALLLGLAIFILTPRIWAGNLRFLNEGTAPLQPITGFAEEVSLGDMGEILENPEIVLEVQFFDNATGDQLDVEKTMNRLGYESPLFRGKVLGTYSNGRWTSPPMAARTTQFSLPRGAHLIRQQIALYPIGTATLFVGGHGVACDSYEEIEIAHEHYNDVFMVESDRRGRRALQGLFEYTAYSSFDDEPPRRIQSPQFLMLQGRYRAHMLDLPAGLEQLRELARSIARPEDGTVLTEAQIAQRMVDLLRNSGEYSYTMSVSVQDGSIDPVEDFLFNRKRGHCEYYASALALMLRSAMIPARMVSGFKGGDLNTQTGRFEVRQLHAHAWVEALVDDEWIVLDATPASRDESVAGVSTSRNPFAAAQEYLRSWWTRGLLMNQVQQRQMIYEPLRRLMTDTFRSVRTVGVVSTVTEWFRELRRNPQEWISVRGFITVFVLGNLISVLVWTLRRAIRWLRSLSLPAAKRARQERRVVAFYERFRALLARQGHTRAPSATHGEFAAAIERDWRGRTDIDGLVDLPTSLTNAFYRVRFGEQLLEDAELHRLEDSLSRLEERVKRPSRVAE